MVKSCVKYLVIVIVALLTVCGAEASVGSVIVVNEALVNEPGSKVSLEWFELYNSSQSSVTLLGDTLSINGQIIAVFGEVVIEPMGYVVITRDIVSFEKHWGDSSGIWGDDTLLENFSISELTFSLRNAAGSLAVFDDTVSSSLSWSSAGGDGISWERVSASGDSVASSVSVFGATPGRLNSVAQSLRDWEIVALEVSYHPREQARIDVTLRNAGAQALPAACLIVYDNPALESVAPFGISGDSLFCEMFPGLNPSEIVTVSVFVSAAGLYDTIGVTVSEMDERLSNNTRIVTLPGVDFPPVQINEFLPNPQGILQSEWIELKNISLLPVDLTGWQIGDEIGFGVINTANNATNIIQPGEYFLLAKSPPDVATFYQLMTLPASVKSWRALNNVGDVVRLRDAFGFMADSVSYDVVYGDNVTWSRSEESKSRGLWGRSALSGGTPGDSNVVFLNANSSGLGVIIEPNPFSPDGDGFAETTSIDITAPDGGDMSVVIYDIEGREIKRLFEGAPFSGSLIWDGTTDSGERVTIGIYIIYIETKNSASVKRTVVVAR